MTKILGPIEIQAKESTYAYLLGSGYQELTAGGYAYTAGRLARFMGKPLTQTTQADLDAFLGTVEGSKYRSITISRLRAILPRVFRLQGLEFPKQSVPPQEGNKHQASPHGDKGFRLTPEEREFVLAAPDHMSYDEIAKQVGISHVSVIRILKKAGRPPRKRGRFRLAKRD